MPRAFNVHRQKMCTKHFLVPFLQRLRHFLCHNVWLFFSTETCRSRLFSLAAGFSREKRSNMKFVRFSPSEVTLSHPRGAQGRVKGERARTNQNQSSIRRKTCTKRTENKSIHDNLRDNEPSGHKKNSEAIHQEKSSPVQNCS